MPPRPAAAARTRPGAPPPSTAPGRDARQPAAAAPAAPRPAAPAPGPAGRTRATRLRTFRRRRRVGGGGHGVLAVRRAHLVGDFLRHVGLVVLGEHLFGD